MLQNPRVIILVSFSGSFTFCSFNLFCLPTLNPFSSQLYYR